MINQAEREKKNNQEIMYKANKSYKLFEEDL